MTVSGQEAGRDALAQLVTSLHVLGGTASRARLTELLGHGRSVTGYLLGDLARRGVVTVDRAVAAGAGETGRPSHRVTVAPTAPVAIGIHLEADRATVATFAIGGQVRQRDSFAWSRSWRLAELIDRLAGAVSAQAGPRVVGVGMAVPSPVRRRDGMAIGMLHLRWAGAPFGELLAARLGPMRLTVGNDANLAALAEYQHGAGRGARQLLYLTTARVGLGGALISEGRLFDGAHGYAMEPGHVTVDPAGAPCVCGSTGCLEVECDHRGLLRAASTPAGESASAREYGGEARVRAAAILDAAAAGDQDALRAVRHVTGRLGIGLASLVNLTDPDRIVLAGGLARYAELAPEQLAASVAARSFLTAVAAVPVTPGELPDAPLRGAADAAFRPLLADPRATLDRLSAS